MNGWAVKRIADLEREVESLKAITELAVDALKDIEDYTASTSVAAKCITALNEIKRLQNDK